MLKIVAHAYYRRVWRRVLNKNNSSKLLIVIINKQLNNENINVIFCSWVEIMVKYFVNLTGLKFS